MTAVPRLVEGTFHDLAGLARAFLDATDQFVLPAFHQLKVVIGECGPFLLDLALDDVPVPLEFVFVHNFQLLFQLFVRVATGSESQCVASESDSFSSGCRLKGPGD